MSPVPTKTPCGLGACESCGVSLTSQWGVKVSFPSENQRGYLQLGWMNPTMML